MRCKNCGTILAEHNHKKSLCDDCQEDKKNQIGKIMEITVGMTITLILLFTKNYFLLSFCFSIFFLIKMILSKYYFCDEESVIWAILAIFALLISLYFIKIDLTPKIYKFYCQKDIHQYKEINATDNMTTIYCPIYKKEKEIETKEWNKMQADKKYPFIVD